MSLKIKKESFPNDYHNFHLELFETSYNLQRGNKYKPKYLNKYGSLDYGQNLLDALSAEQEQAVENLYDLYVVADFKPQRGVLVGTGEVSPFDVGLHLQQPHGFPYLPGSGIQGMVRSYIIEHLFEKNEKLALADAGFRQIFGSGPDEDEKPGDESRHSRGWVDFLDAYPVEVSSGMVKQEVFTNHFQDYYMDEKGKVMPTDKLLPNPVLYLTIANTDFRVYTGILDKERNAPIAGGRFCGFPPLVVVNRYLNLAFEQSGVGARTKNNWGRGTFAPEYYEEKTSDAKPPTE